MSHESNDTGQSSTDARAPQVEREIPSAVTSRMANGKPFLAVFLGVLLMLVYFVLSGKDAPKEAKTERFESAAPVGGVPADLQEQMDALAKKLPPPGSAHPAQALEQARRYAPAVVYNQHGAGGASKQAGNSNSKSNNAGAVTVAPVPANVVAFSNAPSANATLMGNRDLIIGQGKLIDGVLETAINSDQPGMVRALVNVDIYGDSGRQVLLPRGTRIVGRYDAGIVKGQSRVFIVWQRVMRPDGVDLAIESPGTDALGRAGMGGDVNNHFWQMFGAATLLSVIGTTTATVGVDPVQDQNNSISSFRQGVADSFNRSAGSVLDRFIDIKPTITVDQGQMIKIFVSKDLIFDRSLQTNAIPTVIR